MADNQGLEEISEQEIKDIYAEVDGKAPVDDDDIADGKEQKPAEESQPGEDQKDDDAGQPDEKPEAEGDAPKPEEGKDGVKPAEDKPVEVPDPTSEEIDAFAIKHKLSFSEAEAELKATRAILKNYKSPEELARAYRIQQSAYDKLKNEGAKPAEPQRLFERMPDEVFIQQAKSQLAKEGEKHILAFRERFPAKSELMTDQAIIEELAEQGLGKYRQWADGKEAELRSEAQKTKETLLSSISKEDERFIPMVKDVLSRTSDRVVLSKGFDVNDILYHAKGQRYDADVKAAYERGLKKGAEKPEIAGVIGGGQGSAPKKPGVASGLNKEQKARAEEMFPDQSAESAHKMFAETWAEELKKDKNFIG